MREFSSLSALAAHLEGIAVVGVPRTEHKALDSVLEILEKDMREQIGHSQPQVGPYPAWAPLAESTQDEKARLGYPSDAPLLREGDLQDSFTHEREGEVGIVGSTDPTMVYHEFGTDKMPPRPVVGPAAFKHKKEIERLIGERIAEVIGGKPVKRW